MSLNPADPLVRSAVFGRQVEDFLTNDPIGKYLVERADREIEECSIALRHQSPRFWWGRRKIEKLQNRIHICESVLGWLRDSITEGRQALQIIEDHHDR